MRECGRFGYRVREWESQRENEDSVCEREAKESKK